MLGFQCPDLAMVWQHLAAAAAGEHARTETEIIRKILLSYFVTDRVYVVKHIVARFCRTVFRGVIRFGGWKTKYKNTYKDKICGFVSLDFEFSVKRFFFYNDNEFRLNI